MRIAKPHQNEPGSHRFAWLGIIAMILTSVARADGLDYSVGSGARNLPLGAGVFGTVGYGQVFWGEQVPGRFDYGYLRGAARLTTSGTVNKAELMVNIFPVSFFGFTLGHSESVRFADYDWADCTQVDCHGVLGTDYAKAQLLLGYGRIYLSASSRIAVLRPPGTAAFAEESSSLIGVAGGDHLFSNEMSIGAQLWPDRGLGIHLETERMTASGATNDHESVYYRGRSGAWSYYVGAGAYRSSTQARGPTVYGGLQWTGLTSVGIE